MRPTLYRLPLAGTGALSTMTRPRGGDWLEEEMSSLRDGGVDVIVSLLEPHEENELGLQREHSLAEAAGVEFVSCPMPDHSVPSIEQYMTCVERIHRDVTDGRHVVVHCRMAIGRASMVAVGVLYLSGESLEDAWSAVAKARGLEVPDTSQQRGWVASVTQRLRET